MKTLLTISGPTASGKSGLAVRVAKELDGEIVNLDSVQIYKEFDIGSAKITAEEMDNVPHHLIDIKEPTEQCNVSEIVELAKSSIAEIHARGKQVIVVCGTGMYLKHLLYGLAELPERDESLRAELEARNLDELYSELQNVDPKTAARLHPNDKVRIVRALEVYHLSGTAISESQADHDFGALNYTSLNLVLCWARHLLYDRINQRVDLMLEHGLIEEVKQIVKRHGRDLPALKTLGYAQAIDFIDSVLDFEQLREQIAQETRRFAKRQMTFWRNQPLALGWKMAPKQGEGEWLKSEDLLEKAQKTVKDFYVKSHNYPELLEFIRFELDRIAISEALYLNAASL
ncbi:MAG: tRNA (adenosine(37)-N6)-dimethylallyltransferase MiaA [Deltaproteobacteria bacterium]|nr:tRNA (adenosine(37)-N6)-dimethylallyltransferase MiaA [Deltaproteobacteria bacterium]